MDLLSFIRGDVGQPERTRSNLKHAIQNAADINIQDEHGNTSLHLCMYSDYRGFVKPLLEANIDVNIQNHTCTSVLHICCKTEKTLPSPYWYQMFRAGADVNLQDNDGLTPLHHCVISNLSNRIYGTPLKIDIIQLLLSANADVNISDNNSLTPVQHMIQMTLQKFRDQTLYQRFHYAGRIPAAESEIFMLINAGADMDLLNDDDRELVLRSICYCKDANLARIWMESDYKICCEFSPVNLLIEMCLTRVVSPERPLSHWGSGDCQKDADLSLYPNDDMSDFCFHLISSKYFKMKRRPVDFNLLSLAANGMTGTTNLWKRRVAFFLVLKGYEADVEFSEGTWQEICNAGKEMIKEMEEVQKALEEIGLDMNNVRDVCNFMFYYPIEVIADCVAYCDPKLWSNI